MQGSTGSPSPSEHETVGAYALGILDDAEATAFEMHLAGCEWCAQQLDELAGMEPMLAALADLPGTGTPAIGESLSARPSPRLAERLVDEVSERRAVKRRRSFFLVAAAAALIIGGPLTVLAATGGDSGTKGTEASSTKSANSAKTTFETLTDRVSETDSATKVSATVAMGEKAWGTEIGVELKNVTGPEKCSLIAVGKNGERETVSSWSVPEWGYGIANAKTEQAKNPLYVVGGAAFKTNEIDHFEVMTFDGKKLVQIDA
ncbi:RNA polymerase subunit sigma [Streptomyces asoensis]|uniref:RNA polymerase subunit sigma n=1 Tax=Streptomyces asoensis TaxID=249586 RepID=A0A6M4WN77_9ACTN|nr:zf-HC2 domain-containing protein [Streptomyces asoensis]QJT02050.1 RNA polymerase subunit sigma [Streptomyces asoensis]